MREQLWLAHQLNIHLTLWAGGRRSAERDLELSSGLAGELSTWRDAVAILMAALKVIADKRQESRSYSETPEDRESVKEARAAVKVARDKYYERKDELTDELVPGRKAIWQRWSWLKKALRSYSGLRHGTYTAVEESVDQACKKMPLWHDAEPNDPKFKHWTGEGRIGTQVQDGLDSTEIHGMDTRVRIQWLPDRFAERGKGRGKPGRPLDDRSDPGRITRRQDTETGGGRRPEFCLLHLRVGSDKRAPVWATFPMRMHRPIPPRGRVTWAYVSVRKDGPRERWTCELTVDTSLSPRRGKCGTGTVSVDVGWCAIPDGLLILSWHDTQGRHGTLKLTRPWLDALRRVSSLRATRDDNLNLMRPQLCEALGRIKGDLPEWLLRSTVDRKDATPSKAQALAWLGQWKSQARFASLLRRWVRFGSNRSEAMAAGRLRDSDAGDEAAFDLLDAWGHQDHHLWEWERAQNRKALNRRLDLYRLWCVWLVRRYGTIIVEEFDRSEVAKCPNPELVISEGVDAEVDVRDGIARSNRQLACVSSLYGPKTGGCLRSAAAARGAVVIAKDPADTTRECPQCGYVEKWDAAAHRERTPPCPNCGSVHDQDDGAAIVLLKRHERDQSGGATSPGGARNGSNGNGSAKVKGGKYQRRAQKRQAKLDQEITARESGATSAE